MRVIVTLTIQGLKETRLEGDARIFDNRVDDWLQDIGFWLENWHHCEVESRNHKVDRAFIPWGSALFIEEVKN